MSVLALNVKTRTGIYIKFGNYILNAHVGMVTRSIFFTAKNWVPIQHCTVYYSMLTWFTVKEKVNGFYSKARNESK